MDLNDILTCAEDERLMLANIGRCYSDKTLALRVSVEHYRYMVEQIISLRQHINRHACTRLAPDGFSTVADAPSVEQPKRDPTEEAIIAGILNVVRADVAEGSYDNWQPVPKPPLGQDSQDRIQQFATLPDEVTPDAE